MASYGSDMSEYAAPIVTYTMAHVIPFCVFFALTANFQKPVFWSLYGKLKHEDGMYHVVPPTSGFRCFREGRPTTWTFQCGCSVVS